MSAAIAGACSFIVNRFSSAAKSVMPKVNKKPTDYYWCPNCKKVTEHLEDLGTHERDSSGDNIMCLVCKEFQFAWNWFTENPYEDEQN